MSDKGMKLEETRRGLLTKGVAGTLLATSPVVGAAAEVSEKKETPPGHALHGKNVYRGPDVNIDLPAKANTAASFKQADVALLSTETRIDNAEIRQRLNNDTTLSFHGLDAEQRVAEALFQTSLNEIIAGNATPSSSFDGSVGMEFSNTPTGQVVLQPTGDKRLRTVKQSNYDLANQSFAAPGRTANLNAIDAAITGKARRARGDPDHSQGTSATQQDLKSAGFLSSLDLSGLMYDTDEDPDQDSTAPNDWTAIGEDRDFNNLTHNGDYIGDADKSVKGAYAPSSTEQDSDDDYFLFKTTQTINIPGSSSFNPSNGDYLSQAEGMYRKFTLDVNNLNNPEQIPFDRWGPQQTNTTSSETVNVGLSASTGTDGIVSAGANLGWQYTTTSKEVEVTTAQINDAMQGGERKNRAQHVTEWNIQDSAANSTIPGQPSHQVEVNPGESIVSYSFDSKWDYSVAEYECGTSCGIARKNKTYGYSGGALWER